MIEKKKGGSEKEESGNQGDKEKSGVTIDELINKNSPYRRTKKQVLSEPNPELPEYIKPLYPIVKKKQVHEDVARMFENFKKILTKLQVSISLHEILE